MILDAIIPHLTEGVIVADKQWKVKHINQAAKDLLNIGETEKENLDLLAFLAGMNLSDCLDTIKNRQEKISGFLVYFSNNLHPYTINVNLIKLFSEDSDLINIILILRKKQEA